MRIKILYDEGCEIVEDVKFQPHGNYFHVWHGDHSFYVPWNEVCSVEIVPDGEKFFKEDKDASD